MASFNSQKRRASAALLLFGMSHKSGDNINTGQRVSCHCRSVMAGCMDKAYIRSRSPLQRDETGRSCERSNRKLNRKMMPVGFKVPLSEAVELHANQPRSKVTRSLLAMARMPVFV